MSKCSKSLHTNTHQGDDVLPLDDIVYLVKRPGYAFMLILPKACSHQVEKGRLNGSVRFLDRHRRQGGRLDLEGLQDFYDNLSQLMEYLHIERENAVLPNNSPHLKT